MRYILKVVTILSLLSIALNNAVFLDYTETIQEYDMYVYSIQWGNTLCQNNEECKEKIKHLPKNIFTLHGLWPSFDDGSKVDECNKGSEIDVVIKDQQLYNDMKTYWISYTSTNKHFWNHEFNKHGYCYTQRYNKSMDDFFDSAMMIYKKLSLDKLALNALGDVKDAEKTYNYDELLGAFKKALGDEFIDVECKKIDGKNYITEVRFYLDLKFKPRVHHAPTQCKNGPIYVAFEQ
jgi:ribonuclease I